MSSLPSTPFEVHGGCFCNAITYTISIPALESRPLLREPPKRPFGPQTSASERLPLISIDHCNSCRRVAGGIVQVWFICPQKWAAFSLLSRNPTSGTEEQITSKSTAEVLRPSKELQESTFVKGFDSSEHAHRIFCGRCGTPLSFLYSGDDDDMVKEENWGPHFDIALGTFDKESTEIEGMRPGRQGWLVDGIPWVKHVFEEGGKSL
ncbi:hypothetical protein N431DRAFT_435418 [Stipitochalara longipes BDJ]|nr:hypothetical protein N431DRAFT_435418 [Stipitochalara longipes BDJ]